ncbi:MAG: hypothetical protein JWO94_1993 [Verrucomicrobiaceae bacterium]|nr:hypothetical protein [Verrucomicrobiaceae bacterium]
MRVVLRATRPHYEAKDFPSDTKNLASSTTECLGLPVARRIAPAFLHPPATSPITKLGSYESFWNAGPFILISP